MDRARVIHQALTEALLPLHVEVVDESQLHNVPRGAQTHFNVVVVSDAFVESTRVERHRRVHAALANEFAAGLHALTLTLLTPEEWEATGRQARRSPACMGGSKTDGAPKG